MFAFLFDSTFSGSEFFSLWNKGPDFCFLSKLSNHIRQSRRDEMFIVNGLHKVFGAPEERHVADSNRRVQHFAPLELWSLDYLPCL